MGKRNIRAKEIMSKLSGVKSLIIKEVHDYLSDLHLINFLGAYPRAKANRMDKC